MLKHIENQTNYLEYKQRVEDFFKREGLNNLSIQEANGSIDVEAYFSHSPCDCCSRPLGGDRYTCNGYNPTTKEVQSDYSICIDCVYYNEYGQLDDITMMDSNLTNEVTN